MDDSFQFIIESPQHNQGHKKRPRLVTSCDNCRLKKIKCLQPSPETKCEACKASKIPCRFRDRERYFAERSRAIAGPNVGTYVDEQRTEVNPALDAFSIASGSSSPALSSHSNPRSNSHSPKPSGMVSAEGDSSARYQSYPPDPRRPADPSHRHAGSSSVSSFQSSRNDPGYGFNTPPTHSRSPLYQQNSRHLHLFDPEQPQCPHPMLMQNFVPIFFERFGGEFTFLSYEQVVAEAWERRLPPMLSNSIAAIASRYADTIPELVVRGLHNVSETYLDNAKTIGGSISHIPTMDTLHALILLTWSEYKNNRASSFRSYCSMAIRMAMDLGLSDHNAIHMHPSEKERNRRRATWAVAYQLNSLVLPYDRKFSVSNGSLYHTRRNTFFLNLPGFFSRTPSMSQSLDAAAYTLAAYLRIASLAVSLYDYLETLPTVWRFYKEQYKTRRISLSFVLFVLIRMLYDGIGYFVALAAVNVLNLILYKKAQDIQTAAASLAYCVSWIMSQRLLMHLYDASRERRNESIEEAITITQHLDSVRQVSRAIRSQFEHKSGRTFDLTVPDFDLGTDPGQSDPPEDLEVQVRIEHTPGYASQTSITQAPDNKCSVDESRSNCVLKQTSDVGAALWTLVIAVHTTCVLLLELKTRAFVLWVTLLGGWSTIAALVILGPATLNTEQLGPFYDVSGYWCWISPNYPTQRITLDYLFMFLTAFLSFVLYILIFLRFRGNVVRNGWRIRFRKSSDVVSADSQGRKFADDQDRQIAKRMLL
ncbi:hypothetical protein D9615_002347 [Tricholomella constricta]|uniref:Zn(2)-C6 fungal-type domain-containing protein n=1 Tax=Tricholomella constricta TaxID=117010 RepID=A0A8H5M9X6_9AGAR|nr:hypothetical protein D9615_002347 [Tricholomella constricta]